MDSTNLPVQLTSFVGRERALAEITGLFASARLVTLTGPGGSGKTRLSLQSAETQIARFADGVWLVELAPLQDPSLIPAAIGQALYLRLSPDQPALEALCDHLADKHLLIVLDNCEHLIAACAQIARALLLHVQGLQILATSRAPLMVAGERVYPVPGLSVPILADVQVISHQPSFNLPVLLDYDAVRLFVDRARSVSPQFKLTLENAPAVLEICRRLDGLPLALELACARIPVLTVQEIAARLDNRFSLLTRGAELGQDGRHLTLRAAVEWSYNLLPPTEQRLLNDLAVFTGGFSLDTAGPVCNGGEGDSGWLLDGLSSLVAKSFVVAETSDRPQARYRQLETIREYALEKLNESGDAVGLRVRHLNLFLDRTEEASTKLGDAYQQLWLNWLESEHDNLRAALAWALESRQIEAGLRISLAILRFWEIRGYVPEARTWLERLLDRVDDQIPLEIHVQALAYASHLAMFMNNPTAAGAFARNAVAIAEAAHSPDPMPLLIALGGLSSSLAAEGDYEAAYRIGVQTIQLQRESSTLDPFIVGMNYLGSGNSAVDAGHTDTAQEWLSEALRLAREAGDNFRIAHAHATFGKLAFRQENYLEAIAEYEQSIALLRQLDARHDLAAILRSLGEICLRQGDIQKAWDLFWESLAAHQDEQDRTGMVECLVGLGSAAVVAGFPAAGQRLLTTAEALRGPRRGHTWPAKPLTVEPYLEMARSRLTPSQSRADVKPPMTLEQAIEYAQKLRLKREPVGRVSQEPDALSDREREVAQLIAQGKTNQQIAQDLVVSKRTVEKHAANILLKLGLTNRTQIARWALEQGFLPVSESFE